MTNEPHTIIVCMNLSLFYLRHDDEFDLIFNFGRTKFSYTHNCVGGADNIKDVSIASSVFRVNFVTAK